MKSTSRFLTSAASPSRRILKEGLARRVMDAPLRTPPIRWHRRSSRMVAYFFIAHLFITIIWIGQNPKNDRARAAYDIFHPLDGKFEDNVIIQIKNGPIDFQVREPASPLFSGLEKSQ